MPPGADAAAGAGAAPARARRPPEGPGPLPIVHLIAGLGVGGAETALLRLLSLTDRTAWSPRVVSMTPAGALGEPIRALGIPVTSLGMRRGEPGPAGLARLRRILARERPAILQTWMYHADLLGLVAAAGICPTVWNIRHSELAPEATRPLTRLSAWLCARLSRFPRGIVVGSEAARRAHVALGYHPGRMVLIPNGFDTRVFRPDPAARARVRRELGIPDGRPVVGMVARLHPDKGHAVFLEAAGRVAASAPDAFFVLCGEGVTAASLPLGPGLGTGGGEGRVRLLGVRGDVPSVLAACDVAVSASLSEGFPNAVGEAMACALPCVVTDVGDSALLVGPAGMVVPPRDPPALAAAVLRLLRMPPADREAMGARGRARVSEHFSLAATAAGYARLYASILGAAGPGGSREPAAAHG